MPPTGLLIWLCITFLGLSVSVLSIVALSAVPLADNVFDEEQKPQLYEERLVIRNFAV